MPPQIVPEFLNSQDKELFNLGMELMFPGENLDTFTEFVQTTENPHFYKWAIEHGGVFTTDSNRGFNFLLKIFGSTIVLTNERLIRQMVLTSLMNDPF
jgi:hypothetical protein